MASTICSETFHKILSLKGITLRGEIQGGSDHYTRRMFGLPQRARLPFLHQKIMFPEDVDVKTVTSCYKSALSEDLWSHLVCPEASKGASHEHSFFVFVHTDLESSLTQSLPNDTQHISQVYSELSKSTCTKMTATQRKCARVLLYSFILFNADARALGDDFLAVVDALRDSLGDYKGKRNGLGHAQRCIMENAIAKFESNLRQPRDLTAHLANPEEHGMVTQCKSSGGKRQRGLGEAPCNGTTRVVQQKRAADESGDTSEWSDEKAFDRSRDSISPQTCQSNSILGSPKGIDGLFSYDALQNSPSGTHLLDINQDGLLMESYDPFAEAHLSMLNKDENLSL